LWDVNHGRRIFRVEVDTHGDVVLCATHQSGNSAYKYAGDDGNLLWSFAAGNVPQALGVGPDDTIMVGSTFLVGSTPPTRFSSSTLRATRSARS
jgi:hypothetical protein